MNFLLFEQCFERVLYEYRIEWVCHQYFYDLLYPIYYLPISKSQHRRLAGLIAPYRPAPNIGKLTNARQSCI